MDLVELPVFKGNQYFVYSLDTLFCMFFCTQSSRKTNT